MQGREWLSSFHSFDLLPSSQSFKARRCLLEKLEEEEEEEENEGSKTQRIKWYSTDIKIKEEKQK